jgi:hypothetical protein
MGDAAMQRRTAAADRLTEDAGRPAAPGGTGLSATGLAATGAGGTTDGGPGFPVPPMDLPHYHGVGVTVSTAGRTTPGPGDTSAANGTTKEVTGA